MASNPLARRSFLTGIGAAALGGCASAGAGVAAPRTTTVTAAGPPLKVAPSTGELPKRKLGKTGAEVSVIGLGGYHLGSLADYGAASRLVHEAIDSGVTFMDNAWEYHGGKSEEWMGRALEGKRDQVFLMTKVCNHGRDAATAMKQLEDSLRRLRTDHVDLWQVHEVIYENDPELHHRDNGVVEALDRARQQGKTRFVGFTGHKSPAIHLEMLSFGYPYDTAQLPLNPFDGTFRSFEQLVLPVLEQRDIAAIGMKAFNGSAEAIKKGVLEPEEALRYVLSLPVATVVTGCDSLAVLRQNVAIARDATPMSPEDMQALRRRVALLAADGRFELYKTSKRFDGEVGREVHGFPTSAELPL